MSRPSSDRRRTWLFPLLLLLILLAVPAGYFLFLHTPPPLAPPPVATPQPEPEPPPEPPKLSEVTLAEVEGTVELRAADGTWRQAGKGDVLRAQDAVRTSAGSVAVLVGGEAWEVRLEAGTEVTVDELTSSISRLMLESGMATAKVKGKERHTFEVRASGSDAVARTANTGADAEFAISNNGAGTVAVGARQGEVELAGAGKVVIVRAGQQSVVRPGQAPSEPTAVPTSLLLKVKWPSQRVHRTRRLVVSGESTPGAHIEVGGEVVRADEHGRFRHTLQAREGKNALRVRATSVGGGRTAEEAEVQVDTRAPRIGLDDDLWGVKKNKGKR